MKTHQKRTRNVRLTTKRFLCKLPLTFLLISVAGCGKQPDPPALIRPVRTMRVADTDQLSRRTFPGRAEATQAVDLAFEVQGRLVERPVKVGDKVTAGQVLARLDARDYDNDLAASKARLQQAEAYLARISKAVKSGAVAQQDLTDAQSQHDMAAANVSIKEKAVGDTELDAPFDGIVAATYVENFQNVERKQIVLRLLDTSMMELKIDIPEQLIMLTPHLKNITVTFEAYPDVAVPAKVKEIGTEASATTRTYPVTLIMEQPGDFTILAGMTGVVRGKPEPPGEKVVTGFEILGAAIFEDGGKSYVWVVDEASSTVGRREVSPNAVTSFGIRVEGLEPGLTIVTAGAHHLSEGQKVAVAKGADEVKKGGVEG
jgi:RND family efflux transporter MFP subunit